MSCPVLFSSTGYCQGSEAQGPDGGRSQGDVSVDMYLFLLSFVTEGHGITVRSELAGFHASLDCGPLFVMAAIAAGIRLVLYHVLCCCK